MNKQVKGFFSKAKNLGSKGVDAAKSGYSKAKQKTSTAIRDKKRQIAYEVLQETRGVVPNKVDYKFKHPMKQSSLLNEASNMVEEYYAKGSTVKGGGEYRSYINNIYRNQSEQSAREGLMNFASEQGFEISDVENALQVYKYDTEENTWGENYYTKVAIAKMVDMISGKYAKGSTISRYEPFWNDLKIVDEKTGDIYREKYENKGDADSFNHYWNLAKEQALDELKKEGKLSDKYAKGSTIKGEINDDLNEIISTQISKYNQELKKLRSDYRGEYFNTSHEGFLAIDKEGRRVSDWEFYSQEFSEENLKKMFDLYPNAKQIIFSTRLNARSDENENESGVALDHSIMEFDVPTKYAKGGQIKEIVEIKGHSIKHIKNSYDDYWYFVYNSTPFEFETKDDAIKSLNDLIKTNKYANGGGVGQNVRGIAYYITSDSAGGDYRYLSGGFLSKEEFDKFYYDDAILDFYFNVNLEYDWQLEKAIYEQMSDEEVQEEGIQIIGYEISRSDNDDIESNLPYDDDEEYEYALGGDVGNKKDRVIDYLINNEDDDTLMSIMELKDFPALKPKVEMWLKNRDANYGKIYSSIDGVKSNMWYERKFDELGLDEFANGGNTSAFEYSIGGL